MNCVIRLNYNYYNEDDNNKLSLCLSISIFTQHRGGEEETKDKRGRVTNAACPPIVVRFVFELVWVTGAGMFVQSLPDSFPK